METPEPAAHQAIAPELAVFAISVFEMLEGLTI